MKFSNPGKNLIIINGECYSTVESALAALQQSKDALDETSKHSPLTNAAQETVSAMTKDLKLSNNELIIIHGKLYYSKEAAISALEDLKNKSIQELQSESPLYPNPTEFHPNYGRYSNFTTLKPAEFYSNFSSSDISNQTSHFHSPLCVWPMARGHFSFNNPPIPELKSNMKPKELELDVQKSPDDWPALPPAGMSSKFLKSPVEKSILKSTKVHDNLKKEPVFRPEFITDTIALDTESVGTGVDGIVSMVARVSIVNEFGDCVYDKYVLPRTAVVDFRTPFSGIRPNSYENAEDFSIVREEVLGLLKGKTLVGHALENDFQVLFISHPEEQIRDTSKFGIFQTHDGRIPSLRNLAYKFLFIDIHSGEHDSVEDARIAMELYKIYGSYCQQ